MGKAVANIVGTGAAGAVVARSGRCDRCGVGAAGDATGAAGDATGAEDGTMTPGNGVASGTCHGPSTDPPGEIASVAVRMSIGLCPGRPDSASAGR